MHKKSRKHSGVVLVYSLLKKTKKQKKKTGAACPSISSLFPLFGEVEGRRRRRRGRRRRRRGRRRRRRRGGGVVGWRTVPKYFALFPEREPGH